jgi:hypothetical protein
MSGRGGRGRGRGGRIAPGMRPVSEEMRIDIAGMVEAFQRSDENGASAKANACMRNTYCKLFDPRREGWVLSFCLPAQLSFKLLINHLAEITLPAGMSNHDRAVVHSEAKKYGFSSKSHG